MICCSSASKVSRGCLSWSWPSLSENLINGLLYVALCRSQVGIRSKPCKPCVWCSLPQPDRVPNFWRALTSAQRSAPQNPHHCIPRKNTRTFAPGCGVSDTDLNIPGGGSTGVIFAGGAQPAGSVGIVPICAPAVTTPLAAGATVGGAGAAAGVAPLLEHEAPTNENAANSAGRIAFPLTQGGLPAAARLSMPRL